MQPVNASIITIGDELLIGQTIDTNSAWMAQELNQVGVWVRRRVAVGDVREEIWKALDEESSQSDIILITGGLGPTADDITKPLLCQYFGGTLVLNQQVLEHVKYLFEQVYRRPGPLLERNIRQAEVPDNCTVLPNARGTAPGMLFQRDGKIFISMPGVPHEMKGLMTNEVLPRIPAYFSLPAIVHKTAMTAGQGESALAELLNEFEASLPADIKLAYLPSYGMVKLRLTTSGASREEREAYISPWFDRLKNTVSKYLVTDRDEGLEVVIGQLLRDRRQTLATAESCTGGYIAHLITTIPGSSDYFLGSIVSYANQVKENMLGVYHTTLEKDGAVSESTVKQMALGALDRMQAHYSLATSGIMGPGGGSEAKPVGTVWIAVASRERVETKQLQLRYDRSRNISMTAVQGLDLLRRFILSHQ
ncbi:MAG TPA: CinA family nicotinamide mononucleotide deamidase-related protein [Chitinophagaceae bacterium]|nr:CinA family nicotinamide mononucleotide deamidase-related protein [Chitinophagaceae bacterium]